MTSSFKSTWVAPKNGVRCYTHFGLKSPLPFEKCVDGKRQVYIKTKVSPFFCPSVPDEFNTLRSGGAGSQSHVTEVSSVMTANVSDPATSGSANGGQQPQLTSTADTNSQQPPTQPCQMSSPPQPVSTLQHNYSNIQQPAPLVSNKIFKYNDNICWMRKVLGLSM